MKPSGLKQLLKHQIEHGSKLDEEFGSLFIWGPPGIGKSRIPEELAKELGVGMIDFRLILCDPTDLRGLPMPFKDEEGNQRVVWVPPDELPREGKGFLFFDDFPTAPPLVQGAAYQIAIRPHQLGPYRLPEGWVIIAAGNRIEDRSLAHPIPKALANRFRHIELDVNIDDWVGWAMRNNIDPNIIGFLKFRPELMFKFDPTSSENAFPTPRSWEMANRGLTLPKAVLAETLEGTIGKGATAEFIAFLKLQTELPDINTIFQGDNFVPSRTDLKYALVSALATRASTPKHFERLLQYSEYMPEEFCILLVSMLVSKNEEMVQTAPSLDKWARKHQDVILPRKRS